MDDDCKREYLVALETVPELVKAETPRINFLRTEDYNPIKACRRLALYWKHRRHVFGEDRWLLPLNQTGSGALSSTTIEVIRSGCFWIVMEPETVVVIDFSRIERQLSDAESMEWLFYFGTVCSNELTQTTGVTVIHRITEGQRFKIVPGLFEIATSAMPFKFGQKMIISTLDESKKLLAEFLILQTAKMVEYNQRCSPLVIDTPAVEARLQTLQENGISRQSLPSCLGGVLGEEYWQNWIRTRINTEELIGSIVRNKASLSITDDETKTFTRTNVNKKKPLHAKASNDKESVRRRNAIHHQRWLQKQTIRRNALHEKSKLERHRNAQLKALNEKLTSLLAQANYIVAVHASNAKTNDL